MADKTAEGRQEITDYFRCSWSKARKICHAINDTTIFYYTVGRKPHLIISAYERKYGKPFSSLPGGMKVPVRV